MRFRIKSIFNVLFILIISVFLSVPMFCAASSIGGDDNSDFTVSELVAYNQSNRSEIERNNQNISLNVPGRIIWGFSALFISLLSFFLFYSVEKNILIDFNTRAPPLQFAMYY